MEITFWQLSIHALTSYILKHAIIRQEFANLKKCCNKTRTKEKEDNAFTREVELYDSSWRTKVKHSTEVFFEKCR